MEARTIDQRVDIGHVHLKVADLDRALDFYCGVLGFELQIRYGEEAAFVSAGGYHHPLGLNTWESKGGSPSPPGTTGLYHVALLVPDRPALARFLAHVAREGIPLEGLSDHAVSEAIYLRDPDRHGIEVYADRPRETWEGHVGELMTTLPLDVDDLLAQADGGFDGLPDGTRMGHVHFRVRNVDETVGFWRELAGMGLMAQLGPMAAFLSAGGYHHHVGANTWETRGAPPAPAGTARLRHATIVLPDEAERDRLAAAAGDAEEREDGVLVRDPSGNGILLSAR